jgi:hypothetical protein
MDQSRSIGTALMAASALQMLVFSIAVLRRSYLALALPVLGAVAALSGLLFWIGYTMANMEPEPADLDLEDEGAAQISA